MNSSCGRRGGGQRSEDANRESLRDGDGVIVTEQPPSSSQSHLLLILPNVGHQPSCPSSFSLLFHNHLLPAGLACCPPSSTAARSRKSLYSMLLLGAPHLLHPWKPSQTTRILGQSNGHLPPNSKPQQRPVSVLPPFTGRVPQKFT